MDTLNKQLHLKSDYLEPLANNMEHHNNIDPERSVSRKEAIKKAGRFALFTAGASILLLTPRKAVANPSAPGWGDPVNPPGGGTGSGTGGISPQSPWAQPKPPEKPAGGLKNSPWR